MPREHPKEASTGFSHKNVVMSYIGERSGMTERKSGTRQQNIPASTEDLRRDGRRDLRVGWQHLAPPLQLDLYLGGTRNKAECKEVALESML